MMNKIIFYILFGLSVLPSYSQDNFETLTDDKNYTKAETYDVLGNVKTRSVSYFDILGKPTQSQTKDFKTASIWMNQTLYDLYGRPSLQTFSAPIGSAFGYKTDFIKTTSGGTFGISNFQDAGEMPWEINYSVDFELLPTIVTDKVGQTVSNTLGYYFSENNTNGYQDVTDYPYTGSIYSKLNPGTVLKTMGGKQLDAGIEVKNYSFSMPATQELSQTVAFNDVKYNTIETVKTVVSDAHGVETVVFTDTDGKVLAAARSGNEEHASTPREMSIIINELGYVDVHIPVGCTGIEIDNPLSNIYPIVIYDLKTETIVATTTIANLPSGFYRVSINDNLSSYKSNISSYPVEVTYKENYYDYSLNEYNKSGQLIASYQPYGSTKAAKPVTTFEYNTLGQLVETTSPDEGTAKFKYRNDGQIRFSQNSKQLVAGEFSYTNYDDLGRPVESGVAVGTFSSLDPNVATFSFSSKKEQQFTVYDYLESSDLSFLSGITGNYDSPSFIAGNVAKTENDNTFTYYSYDLYGRVKWMVQNISGLGTKTIDYEYDPITGQVNRVLFQKDQSDEFIHRYTYDAIDNSLVKVETSTDGSTYTNQAEYEYYETGALKRVEMAPLNGTPLQGIDYVYNLNGQLKSINHPSLTASKDPGGDANDLFGMQIDYHQDDYLRNTGNIETTTFGQDQHNGNIKGVRWNNSVYHAGTGNEAVYDYRYNKNNWLTNAYFGNYSTPVPTTADETVTSTAETTYGNTLDLEATVSITLQPGFHAQNGSTFSAKIYDVDGFLGNGDYDVSSISYDANGNISTLDRNKDGGVGSNAMDQLSYNYNPQKPNQLVRVDDAVGQVLPGTDLDDQTEAENYVYNEIGQLIENKEENIEYIYNASGLVTEVKQGGFTRVKFFYNDKGHRVKKEAYVANSLSLDYTEYYVRDAAGTAMAIYRGSDPIEYTIYGASRLGIYKAGSSVYQLTDHLGNVRAVAQWSGTNAVAMVATDYYPFGMPMPGRDIVGDYRYKYQGQEKDQETGMEAFELRLWDSRMGRWLTTDPYGQFSSPYLGMHNNPINAVDPDGGFSWLGALWFQLWNGGEISTREYHGSDESYYVVTGYLDDGGGIAVGKSEIADARERLINRFLFDLDGANARQMGQFHPSQIMFDTNSRLKAFTSHVSMATVSSAPPLRNPGTAINTVNSTGTVWDDIVVTQSSTSNSVLPKSFEMTTNSGKVWVHPNATKHMAEYVSHLESSGRLTQEALRLSTQVHLKSFHSAVSTALKNGVKYDEMMNVGGWELIFSAPRQAGLLPVVKHALGK